MADVPLWRLFAFMDSDPEGRMDEHRTVPEWQLDDVLRWCRTRGYENIYLCRLEDTARFEKASAVQDVRHVYHD